MIVAANVNMHVPQAGNEILSSTINHLRLFRYASCPCGCNRFNTAAQDDDGHVPSRGTAANIDYGDVSKGSLG